MLQPRVKKTYSVYDQLSHVNRIRYPVKGIYIGIIHIPDDNRASIAVSFMGDIDFPAIARLKLLNGL